MMIRMTEDHPDSLIFTNETMFQTTPLSLLWFETPPSNSKSTSRSRFSLLSSFVKVIVDNKYKGLLVLV